MFKVKKIILPDLSEEYDKNYFVLANTVKIKVLKNSDYTISHRPYFAMKDSTHDVFTINPYKKSCVDAAPNNESTITFKEFLEIFNNN